MAKEIKSQKDLDMEVFRLSKVYKRQYDRAQDKDKFLTEMKSKQGELEKKLMGFWEWCFDNKLYQHIPPHIFEQIAKAHIMKSYTVTFKMCLDGESEADEISLTVPLGTQYNDLKKKFCDARGLDFEIVKDSICMAPDYEATEQNNKSRLKADHVS